MMGGSPPALVVNRDISYDDTPARWEQETPTAKSSGASCCGTSWHAGAGDWTTHPHDLLNIYELLVTYSAFKLRPATDVTLGGTMIHL